MQAVTALSIRHKTLPSANNIIQIQNGTFYRQYPGAAASSALQHSDPPPRLFPELHFSLPALPLRSDTSNGAKQQHWAVIGASGSTTFLQILRGSHVCIPPNARTFPYLSSDDIEAKDHRLRSPAKAIRYVGFTSSNGQAAGGGIKGSYLSARYESRREETDWTVIQYLRGETELNPSEKSQCKNLTSAALLSRVIKDLRLERLAYLPVSNLSNGQTRRARIAKALLDQPEVLLLDEPFMGLDPPTLFSLSPILCELAYKASPRLIMSLRPQDPIPDWITHLAILGQNYTLALAGPKEEVLFAVHRWADAYMSPKNGTAARMAALMTREYGRPLLDIGYTLTSSGMFPYVTGSSITSSKDPIYVHSTGELAPEYLSLADQKIWYIAAEKPRQDADLHDLLALTSLLPMAFTREAIVKSRADETNSVNESLNPNHKTTVTQQVHPRLEKPLIELKNVVVAYGTKTVLGHGVQPGFNTPGLNHKICQGSRLAVLGPNGSGKTTFLSLLTSDHPKSYSLPIKYFGRYRLPSPGKPGLSLWEIQSRIGHSSPEIHTFFPKAHSIRRSLESAWADAFAAKPKLSEKANILVDAFLKWWEPELNPDYRAPRPANESISRDDRVVTSYSPSKHPAQTVCELDWASSPINAFGTLSFQAQRLVLFLRAIIKSPDIVILDEAFSGFSPDVRDKAMLFIAVGEAYMLFRQSDAAHKGSKAHEVVSTAGRSSRGSTGDSSADVEDICRQVGIAVYELAIGKRKLGDVQRQQTGSSMDVRREELFANAAHKHSVENCAFEGLNSQQALIVVSHVREEIPGMVNEYVRLPGEEEVSEQGRSIEMGTCDGGSIRTVEVWNKIWGLRT